MHEMGSRRLAGLIVLVILVSVGCSSKNQSAIPPAPDVSVACPVEKDVVEWDTYTGYLQAPEVANVAARVSGLIMEMPFEEGAIVKRGDLLAMIDDRPFKADFDSKQAEEQKAEAALAIAKLTYGRRLALKNDNGRRRFAARRRQRPGRRRTGQSRARRDQGRG